MLFRLAAVLTLLLPASPALAQNVEDGVRAWVSGNEVAAVQIWEPLASNGDAEAQFRMGLAYKSGRGTFLDLSQAQRFFLAAANQGHREAQASLGLMIFQSGDKAGAMPWLKVAAEADEPRALLIYGTAMYNGDNVARDNVRAYAMVMRAAAQGLAPAMDTLAKLDAALPAETRQQGAQLAESLGSKADQPTRMARATTQPRSKSAPRPKPAPREEIADDAEPEVRIAQAPAPRPKPVAAPKPKPAASPFLPISDGGWRVQLAAGQRSQIESLGAKLRGVGPLAGRQIHIVPVQNFFRLQAGPFASRADAAAACKMLSARGQACFPTAAK